MSLPLPAVSLQSLHPQAILPARATPDSAGFDLSACLPAPVLLAPGQRSLIPTGWAMAIPVGYEGQIRPRSGLALKHGITVLNAPGTIDADYRGEVKVLLINLGDTPYTVQPGDRIAQLLITQVPAIALELCDSLPATERQAGGFGHSGR